MLKKKHKNGIDITRAVSMTLIAIAVVSEGYLSWNRPRTHRAWELEDWLQSRMALIASISAKAAEKSMSSRNPDILEVKSSRLADHCCNSLRVVIIALSEIRQRCNNLSA